VIRAQVSRLAHWTLGEVGAELLTGLGDAPLRGGWEDEGTPPWQAVLLQLRHAVSAPPAPPRDLASWVEERLFVVRRRGRPVL